MLQIQDYFLLAFSVAIAVFYFNPKLYTRLVLNVRYENGKDVRSKQQSKQQPSSSSSITTSQAPSSDHPVLEKFQQEIPSMLIIWGSQTGTAEGFASRLMKESIMHGIKCLSIDASYYDDYEFLKDLPQHVVVCIIIATYGDGEPTDNSRDFYEYVMDECVGGDVSFPYLVFGLGNSSYEHFNHVARTLGKKLTSLGCTSLIARGESDDYYNDQVEQSFVNWSTEALQFLGTEHFIKQFPDFRYGQVEGDYCVVRSYQFQTITSQVELKKPIYTGEHGTVCAWSGQQKRVLYDAKNPYYAPVLRWRELIQGDNQEKRSVLHVELDISNANMRYTTGDHVAIYPRNNKLEVELLAQSFGLTSAQLDSFVFSMKAYDAQAAKKSPFPCPCTLRAALTYYVDINVHPPTNLLKILGNVAQVENDKESLHSLATDNALYHQYIIEDGRNLRQVLEDHPSVRIPLQPDYSLYSEADLIKLKQEASQSGLELSNQFTIGDLLEMLPRLQPRYYSISCSPKYIKNSQDEKSIHVTASVVQYSTQSGRNVSGVCTGYLQEMCQTGENIENMRNHELSGPECLVPLFIRTSKFRLPKNSLTPIIMIGPGTGLAPFRGFIQEREDIARQKIADYLSKKPKTVLNRAQCQITLDTVGKLDFQVHQSSEQQDGDSAIEVEKFISRSVLFFGCRNRNEDFLYQKELLSSYMPNQSTTTTDVTSQAQSGFGLTDLICAFSRESAEKVYVQHRLLDHAEMVFDLLKSKGAYLYVCGDASNMARDVHQTLEQICRSVGSMSEYDASQFIKSLRDKGRYQEDVWS
ncbi:hypothetical protein MIR68_012689 [Amoeboaphelidium protococcarum]|nr:hypothetical protein MIR68_012689 [Amoeboaphelidium protococcarum]